MVNARDKERQPQHPLSQAAHSLDHHTIVKELSANQHHGLTTNEAKIRLEKHGRNELEGGPGVQPFKILLRQVANAMMLVCIVQYTHSKTTLGVLIRDLGPYTCDGSVPGD